MKQLLNITCKKATYLISKKESNQLSLLDNLRLRIHLGICSMCRLFQKQSFFFSSNAKHTHEHSSATLSPVAKEKIKQALQDSK